MYSFVKVLFKITRIKKSPRALKGYKCRGRRYYRLEASTERRKRNIIKENYRETPREKYKKNERDKEKGDFDQAYLLNT